MFHSERDLLVNLIVLSPKAARKRFRQSIFEAWHWKCAYCDEKLDQSTATIDHVVPRHRGGHNTRNNLVAACGDCNRSKASQLPFEYLNPTHQYYSEQRVGKLKEWMEQKPCSLRLSQATQGIPYIPNDPTYGWSAS